MVLVWGLLSETAIAVFFQETPSLKGNKDKHLINNMDVTWQKYEGEDLPHPSGRMKEIRKNAWMRASLSCFWRDDFYNPGAESGERHQVKGTLEHASHVPGPCCWRAKKFFLNQRHKRKALYTSFKGFNPLPLRCRSLFISYLFCLSS